MYRLILVILLSFIFFSCTAKAISSNVPQPQHAAHVNDIDIISENEKAALKKIHDDISSALNAAAVPPEIFEKIKKNLSNDNSFINELNIIHNLDPYLWILVDKEHALSAKYAPSDLVLLENGNYRVSRADHYLRRNAALSLDEMAIEAKKAGVTLTASSTYRSYDYQVIVYNSWVEQLGRQQADKVSARPGHSQHQLGHVVDFGSITNAFAATAEGRWIAANASGFGWSLSYPKDIEHITGYSWESWHYRYVGKETAAFIDKYFEGVQQYALKFLYEYNEINKSFN